MGNELMQGKRGLIMGLANDKSIAWGIAKACADAGAELAFSYMGDQFKKRVAPLADQLGAQLCDALEPGMSAGGKILDHHSCDFYPERWCAAPSARSSIACRC